MSKEYVSSVDLNPKEGYLYIQWMSFTNPSKDYKAMVVCKDVWDDGVLFSDVEIIHSEDGEIELQYDWLLQSYTNNWLYKEIGHKSNHPEKFV